MKQINNFDQVKESEDFKRLVPGGYIAQIFGAEDVADKEYLKISYDIVEGEFKDYFREQYKRWNNWNGVFYRSYKEKALSMFKSFIVGVEKSNKGFVWNWDESALKGLKVGLVLGEEEYIPTGGTHAGELRTRLYVRSIVPVEKIRNKDFKVPELKKLPEDQKPVESSNPTASMEAPLDLSSDELPF